MMLVSSGSESDPRYANMDDKKRKRMISNRESARRSRMKKQQHMDQLLNQVTTLKSEIAEHSQTIDAVSQRYVAVELENNVLRAQLMELTDRLTSLNSVLKMVEEVSGFSMDIPDVLLEPWHLPCPLQPVSNIFQC